MALKIILADASDEDCAELMLLHLKDLDFDQPGGKHIALPMDHFWIEGPNGRHLCLVLPVLGPRVPIIWNVFPDAHKTSRDIISDKSQAVFISFIETEFAMAVSVFFLAS